MVFDTFHRALVGITEKYLISLYCLKLFKTTSSFQIISIMFNHILGKMKF